MNQDDFTGFYRLRDNKFRKYPFYFTTEDYRDSSYWQIVRDWQRTKLNFK